MQYTQSMKAVTSKKAASPLKSPHRVVSFSTPVVMDAFHLDLGKIRLTAMFQNQEDVFLCV